jgi:hypothetical protein
MLLVSTSMWMSTIISSSHSLRAAESSQARTEKKEGKDDFLSFRMRCSLCNKQTNMYCTGCKRFLCVDKDRRKELGEVGEPHVVRMKQLRKNTDTGLETTEAYYGMRSCYQIAHEKTFNAFWETHSEEESHFARVSNGLFEHNNETGQENARHNTL